MQSRIGPDGHVSSAEVVVNRSDDADDVQEGVLTLLLFRDQLPLPQSFEQLWPLLLEAVCAGEGAVASDDDQIGDGLLDEVFSGLDQPFLGVELHAPGRADDGAALKCGTIHDLSPIKMSP